MEGDSSHNDINAIVSSHTITDINFLDLGMQNCTPSSQSGETRYHLSSGSSVQPGAKKALSIIYFNARSHMPKMDALCVLVESNRPDVICIVESWLCNDITDNEIDIPGYNVHRLDRNRRGGGIVMYTNENLVVNAISNLPSNLEFFAVSIRCLNHKLCLGIFYCPPSSPSSIFDTFSQSLETLDISQFSNFVCVGDFNIDFNNSSHHMYPKLRSVSQLLGLSQVVTGYTRFSLWSYLLN